MKADYGSYVKTTYLKLHGEKKKKKKKKIKGRDEKKRKKELTKY